MTPEKAKTILAAAGLVLAGVAIGAYLFNDTQPRSVLALHRCEQTCLRPNELVGLMTSVGVQRFPSFMPKVVMETDKTLVIQSPSPQARIHYLIIPKRDIKDIASTSEDDKDYLMDVFRVVNEIVKEQHLEFYRVSTNGPGYQSTTYLHFHLMAQ